jgi:hypothetical protein
VRSGARRALQSSPAKLLRCAAVAGCARCSSEIGCSFRVQPRRSSANVGFCAPASPFAIPSASRVFCVGVCRPQSSSATRTSLRVSPSSRAFGPPPRRPPKRPGLVAAGFRPGRLRRRPPRSSAAAPGRPGWLLPSREAGTSAACNSPGAPAEAAARLSWAFCPFSTCRQRRSGGAMHCQMHRRSVLRVWSPSRRLHLSVAGPALFRAGSAPGILPFGASSA